MKQFVKNLLIVIAVALFVIVIPLGITFAAVGDVGRGFGMAGSGVGVLILSTFLAGKYHDQGIDVSGWGIIAAIVVAVAGVVGALVHWEAHQTIFLKMTAIGITLTLHGMVESKLSFFLQKIGIATAMITVMFLSSAILAGVGAAVTFLFFLASVFSHAPKSNGRSEEAG